MSETQETRTVVSGSRKAAVLLLAMGEEASANVFRHLSEHEVETLAREMASLGDISTAESERILEEVNSAGATAEPTISGTQDFARRVLTRALGEDAADKIFDRVQQSVVSSAGFTTLQNADPQQLSKFIVNEHPQTIALILAHMQPANAAHLVASLPDDIRAEVLTRLAKIEEISPDVITRIAATIEQRLRMLGGPTREQKGGVRAVASLFNHLERTVSAPALEAIEERTPDLAMSIRNLMFVFEDLVRVDDNGMRELVQRVDKKVLTTALKGAGEEVRQRFLGNMSKRAGEMMREDMEALGAVRLRDVEKAQFEIVSVARNLEEEGVISTSEGGEDAYVI